MSNYKEYFNIEDKQAVMDKAQFEKNPQLVTNFYPHKDFVKLLEDTQKVLSRQEKKSIWIEGVYGTGKTHAVLTLQNLLDCNEAELVSYFDSFQQNLSKELKDKYVRLKQTIKILTAFKSGDSGLHTQDDLIPALQMTISKRLKEKGLIEAEGALKEAGVRWLKDATNAKIFQTLIDEDVDKTFTNPNTVEGILKVLESEDEDAILGMVQKCSILAKNRNIDLFTPNLEEFKAWVNKVIEVNKLTALVFFWDELTKFFENSTSLVVFQEIAQMSMLDSPFILIPVTHSIDEKVLGDSKSAESKKIRDRFIVRSLALSSNIAIELMANALRKNEARKSEWEGVENTLNDRVDKVRKIVANSIKAKEEHIRGVLPIHPYSTLVLKHLAKEVASNQRSIFTFIADNEDKRSFKYFLANNKPHMLLTVPHLWHFFYEGVSLNNTTTRSVMQAFNNAKISKLNDKEQMVLKAILLLIATSKSLMDSDELLLPTEDNLRLVFEGCEVITVNNAVNIANSLLKDNYILTKTQSGKTKYDVSSDHIDTSRLKEEKEKISLSTKELAEDAELGNILAYKKPLELRFDTKMSSVNDFSREVGALNNSSPASNKIYVRFCIASSQIEANKVREKIAEASKNIKGSNLDFVLVDASRAFLSDQDREEYKTYKARENILRDSNRADSQNYARQANQVLNRWKDSFKKEKFVLHILSEGRQIEATGLAEVLEQLYKLNARLYPYAPENIGSFVDTLFPINNRRQAADLGILEDRAKPTGAFSGGKTQIASTLDGAWMVSDYWVYRPELPISKIKKEVDLFIENSQSNTREVSLNALMEHLSQKPYGFLGHSISAFFLGFLLKEYAREEGYTYRFGDVDEPLTESNLQTAIVTAIENISQAELKKKPIYIGKQSEQANAFAEKSQIIFNLRDLSLSVAKVRENLRQKMQDFVFPLWALKESGSFPKQVENILDMYIGILNTRNFESGTDTEYNIASKIGQKFISQPSIVGDLKNLIEQENFNNGMRAVVMSYKEGELSKLATSLGYNYLELLMQSFKQDAGSWAWDKETGLSQVKSLIEWLELVQVSKVVGVQVSKTEGSAKNALVDSWRIELEAFKVPSEILKDFEVDTVLLDSLKEMYVQRTIHHSSKFLELLKAHKDKLKDLLAHKASYFNKFLTAQFTRISAQEQNAIYDKAHQGQFAKDKDSYMAHISQIVTEHAQDSGREKLRAIWFDKTGSNTPREWSSKSQTPALIFCGVEEISKAKRSFGIINGNLIQPSGKDIEEGLQFLSSLDWLCKLSDKSFVDSKFGEVIIGRYIGLVGVNEARKYLSDKLIEHPYDWFDSKQVQDKVREIAEVNYKKDGISRAIEAVDRIGDPQKLRDYIKRLIKDSLDVGIQIMKEE